MGNEGFPLVLEPAPEIVLDGNQSLMAQGIYYISGEIEQESLKAIQEDIILKSLTPTWHNDLQILINSPGGSVTAMWALIDLMDWSRLQFHTTGLGQCASAAAVILAAGSPGKRALSRNTEVMIHSAWIDSVGGNKAQLHAAMHSMDEDFERDIRFWSEHSVHATREEIEKELLTTTDTYLNAEEALAHGIVDVILPARPRTPPIRRSNGRKRRRVAA